MRHEGLKRVIPRRLGPNRGSSRTNVVFIDGELVGRFGLLDGQNRPWEMYCNVHASRFVVVLVPYGEPA